MKMSTGRRELAPFCLPQKYWHSPQISKDDSPHLRASKQLRAGSAFMCEYARAGIASHVLCSQRAIGFSFVYMTEKYH
jgi:hypothetical protein